MQNTYSFLFSFITLSTIQFGNLPLFPPRMHHMRSISMLLGTLWDAFLKACHISLFGGTLTYFAHSLRQPFRPALPGNGSGLGRQGRCEEGARGPVAPGPRSGRVSDRPVLCRQPLSLGRQDPTVGRAQG